MDNQDNEVLRGISARILTAISLLALNEHEEAGAVLVGLMAVLPEPAQNNIDAVVGKL